MGVFETIRSRLDRHSAGNFGHRCEKRQAAIWGGHGLISDTGSAARDEIAGLIRIGCQMQIRKQNLPRRQHGAFVGLRFFDLYDHLSVVEDVFRVFDNLGSD